jgi:hemoglobin
LERTEILDRGAAGLRGSGVGSGMRTKPFDKYGGYATVRRIVLAMYDRLLADDEVGSFFTVANMPNLVDHQTLLVSTLMGGPTSYSDQHIADVHRSLDLTDAYFDRLKGIVEETFADFALDRTDIASCRTRTGPRRHGPGSRRPGCRRWRRRSPGARPGARGHQQR